MTTAVATVMEAATEVIGVGHSRPRPDGRAKAMGELRFSGDLEAEGMLWAHLLRSPHPAAAITRIDASAALAMPGVHAVLTAADVPGRSTYGLNYPDQPVFAATEVRHVGEVIAAVAADHPLTAAEAAEAVVVEYDLREAVSDPEAALAPGAPEVHPLGKVLAAQRVVRGDPTAEGDVTVEAYYEMAVQDQAFLGTEAALAIPGEDGGVDLYVATQWLHVDQDQISASLDLPHDKVRIHLAGVGGSFGAREDLSVQIPLGLLALRTGRPVKVVLSRQDSFLGHVHRHPARMWYRHSADRDGHLVKVEARIILDGGAYLSSSGAVLSNAACFAAGPYRVPNAVVDATCARTNNPPSGAMRGFGTVQVCFAYEAQMDKLAAALGMSPVELRLRNALGPGDDLITGQVLTGAVPVAELIRACADAPLPPESALEWRHGVSDGHIGDFDLPGGVGRAADAKRVKRGVGLAVGFKNLMYSAGFDDYSVARCHLEDGRVTLTSAAAEVGQGLVTLMEQIAAEVLGADDVVLAEASTIGIGSAGSTSASRQSVMTGGAVEAACRAVADDVLAAVADDRGLSLGTLRLAGNRLVSDDTVVDLAVAKAAAETRRVFDRTVTFGHPATEELDEDGQGNAHVAFAFAVHRAVVDVDVDLGLVKVVHMTTAQDVGRALNPLQLLGQIEGGTAQGIGLALMEELVIDHGRVRNPSFTDYVIPTALDIAPVRIAALIEEPQPGLPFGAKGAGELPSISSTPAVLAAVRDATGLTLDRAPVRPEDIALAKEDTP